MYISLCHEYDCSASYIGEPFKLKLPSLKQGEPFLLVPAVLKEAMAKQVVLPHKYFLEGKATGRFAVGTTFNSGNNPLFTVVLRMEIPAVGRVHSLPAIRVVMHRDIEESEVIVTPCRSAPSLAWITVSDKGATGERVDEGGPLVGQMLQSYMSLRCVSGYIVPDEPFRLCAMVTDLALVQGYDFIITTGGTGVGPRDITPETVLPLVRKRLTGFEEAMINSSMQASPRGIIARPVCGTVGDSILITLPGSPKAIQENLTPILPALEHALAKIQGSVSDCAR